MAPQNKIDLLEFARIVKDGCQITDEEFVDQMRGVLPIDSLRDITPEESEWLFMAISWLHDYSLLLWEFHQVEVNKGTTQAGLPAIPGSSGPFIENILTRDGRPDFSQLRDFGLGRKPRLIGSAATAANATVPTARTSFNANVLLADVVDLRCEGVFR